MDSWRVGSLPAAAPCRLKPQRAAVQCPPGKAAAQQLLQDPKSGSGAAAHPTLLNAPLLQRQPRKDALDQNVVWECSQAGLHRQLVGQAERARRTRRRCLVSAGGASCCRQAAAARAELAAAEPGLQEAILLWITGSVESPAEAERACNRQPRAERRSLGTMSEPGREINAAAGRLCARGAFGFEP